MSSREAGLWKYCFKQRSHRDGVLLYSLLHLSLVLPPPVLQTTSARHKSINCSRRYSPWESIYLQSFSLLFFPFLRIVPAKTRCVRHCHVSFSLFKRIYLSPPFYFLCLSLCHYKFGILVQFSSLVFSPLKCFFLLIRFSLLFRILFITQLRIVEVSVSLTFTTHVVGPHKSWFPPNWTSLLSVSSVNIPKLFIFRISLESPLVWSQAILRRNNEALRR